MLKAIISQFPIKEDMPGIGALNFPADKCKLLAQKSRRFVCPKCGPIKALLMEPPVHKKVVEMKTENS